MSNSPSPVLQRVRLAFEWARNAFFLLQLAQLFTALGVGKAVKAVLTIYYHLDPLWVSPIWMLTTAAVLAAFDGEATGAALSGQDGPQHGTPLPIFL